MTGVRKHDLGGKPGRNMLAQPKQHREKVEEKGAIQDNYSQIDKRSH